MFFWGKHAISDETLLIFYIGESDRYGIKSDLYILKREQYNIFLRPFNTEENKIYNNELLQNWKNGTRIDFPNPHDHIVWNISNSAIIPDYIRINRSDIIKSTHKKLSADYLSQEYYRILFSSLDILHKDIISSKYYKEDFSKKLEMLKDSVEKAKNNFGKSEFYKETLNPKASYDLFGKIRDIDKNLKTLFFKTNSESNTALIDSKLSKAYEKLSNGELNSAFEDLKAISKDIFSLDLEKRNREEFKEKVDYYFLLIKQKKEIIKEEKIKLYKSLLRELDDISQFVNSTIKWGEVFSLLKSFSNKVFSSHLLKEHKEEIKSKINNAYQTLNYRKEKAEQEYKEQCRLNYYRLSNEFSSVVSYNYCNNEELDIAIDTAKKFKLLLKETSPLKKEDRDDLSNRLSYYLDLFYKKLKDYKIQKKNDWIKKQYEKIDKLNSIVENKRSYIYKLNNVLSSKENYLYTTKNQDKQNQVRFEISDIRSKIQQVENEISSIINSIYEIKNKL